VRRRLSLDAALAKYPNATIQRVETDSDGVYEAHIVTAAGDELIVQVGKDFTVTGTQTGGPGVAASDVTTATGRTTARTRPPPAPSRGSEARRWRPGQTGRRR
jgi:hypothetical protein